MYIQGPRKIAFSCGEHTVIFKDNALTAVRPSVRLI